MNNLQITTLMLLGWLGLAFSMYLLTANYSQLLVWYVALPFAMLVGFCTTEIRKKIRPPHDDLPW